MRVPAPGLVKIKADQPKIHRLVASVSAMDTIKKNPSCTIGSLLGERQRLSEMLRG
jgi:hypothetical protein